MSKQCFRNSVLLVLSLFLAGAATESAGPGKGNREPIVITSDSMKAVKLDDRVEFIGNVTLKKEGMTLYSDTVTVFYDARTKGIREIEARGNVVVRKEGRVAHAGRARYYSSDEKIVLTGDARILENENEIGGDRITLFMRDDRSIVEGGKVLFYQDPAESKKQKTEERKQKAEIKSQKPEPRSQEQD
jgi:lipopolysaccharide export system protein LptA